MQTETPLDKRAQEKIRKKLWNVSGCLLGVGTLLENAGPNSTFEDGELFGLGQLLRHLSKEISEAEIILQGEPLDSK